MASIKQVDDVKSSTNSYTQHPHIFKLSKHSTNVQKLAAFSTTLKHSTYLEDIESSLHSFHTHDEHTLYTLTLRKLCALFAILMKNIEAPLHMPVPPSPQAKPLRRSLVREKVITTLRSTTLHICTSVPISFVARNFVFTHCFIKRLFSRLETVAFRSQINNISVVSILNS